MRRMFDISPVSSSIVPSQDQNQELQQDQSSGSMEHFCDPFKTRIPSLKVVHPNTALPGRWCGYQLQDRSLGWHRQAKDKRAPFVPLANRNMSLSQLGEESSMDEFYEATEHFGQYPSVERFTTYTPLSSALEDFDPEIRPHMTEPLLPDGSPLDFSPIEKHRGKTNVFSATPLARVWEFNSVTDKHEYSILNILADEFENLEQAENEPQPGFWSQFKKLTIGLTEDEYDDHYPWAKYCVKGLLDCEDEGSDTGPN